MINLILSEMQREHLEQVAELEKICFSQPWSYTSLEEELDNETAHFFVATVDDRVVGYIGVFVVSDSCFISNIAVLPDYRRQGVGRALMKIAMLTADVMGTEFISLEVRPTNYPAVMLYKSLGFDEMGRRRDFYRNPREDALIMTKIFSKKE